MPDSKELSTPLIAVDINTTEQTPITIPSVVKAERILFALIAEKDISSPSFN